MARVDVNKFYLSTYDVATFIDLRVQMRSAESFILVTHPDLRFYEILLTIIVVVN